MEILGEALDREPDQRAQFVRDACGDDAEMLAEIERLLSRENKAVSAIPSVHSAIAALENRTTLPAPDTLIGKRVGAYEFMGIIGQGGMGVVYRGRDTRLDRDVAIKAISPNFTGDASLLTRFEREARVLASISHPNIATVYGLEEDGTARFMVMELMAGDTLARRLASDRLSIESALCVGLQIATALEAAHAAGIVHRDLKPGNVMFTADGTVKVLDFGLARHQPRASQRQDETRVTTFGSIVGTPGYMSPEQLRGEPVDRRADVFAFGCVLFECLTGRLTFEGASSAQVVAAVLEREPDWSALPARTPRSIRKLLERCLAKDPQRRLCDLGDARLEIDEALERREWMAPSQVDEASRPRRAAMVVLSMLAAVAATIAVAAIVARRGAPAGFSAPAQQYAIPFPNAEPQNDVARIRVALSRSGQSLVVSASDGKDHRLWIRDRGEIDFRPMEGTEGGRAPSLSPDGQWLLYFYDGAMMKRRTAGGQSYRIYNLFGWWGSAFWGNDDLITFLPAWGRGAARISPEGGSPKFVTDMRHDLSEFAHLSPWVLNDARTILVTTWDGKSGLKIIAIDMETGTRHAVVENAWTPRVASTPHGDYLLWCRANTLFAAPLDQSKAALTGSETAIVDGVLTDRVLFTACYDVADDGTLVYVPGGSFIEKSRLSWLQADGKTTIPMNDDRMSFGDPQFSRDGSRLLLLVKGDEYKAYMYDLKRGTFESVVADSDIEDAALSSDGQRLVYTSNRDGPYALWIRNLSNSADEKVSPGMTEYQATPDFSPDGKYVVFTAAPPDEALHDIWQLDTTTKQITRLFASPSEERNTRFAPTGKWLAYVSDISGTREVYIRSHPDGAITRQVTFGGADWPDWSPDGSTIYFRRQGWLWSVPIAEDGTTSARPTIVYAGRFGQSDYHLGDYCIAPDGKILLVEPSEQAQVVPHLNVLLNWHRKLPAH